MKNINKYKKQLIPWLFLSPAIFIFSWLKFTPIIKGMTMSFYNVNFYSGDKFVGLDNFSRALSDIQLHNAVGNTLVYVIVSTILSCIIAFAVALALQEQARHIKIIRTAIFIPAVTSVAIIAEIWRIAFYPVPYGVINTIIGWFSIEPQGFLSDPDQALLTVILLQVWKSVPYNMVIFLAGLSGVSRDLYDAASVDGANIWRKIWHVTIPGLVPAISVVVMLSFIRGFRVFAEIYTTTGGGPGGSTEVIMTHVFKAGFERFDYGYATAISFLLLVFTLFLTLAHTKIMSRFNY
ncbi:carbohydrate ABC transporter permease [Vibrio nigripulchritudo]|uniref:carbohydrate ABC transporter permease n=1 Tax=Vibrio nigripulchritudo TaxID=28173 RepID=UPI0003B23DCC|nr:sugar ABC transporter permease [Vibrio nigripulchritudo]CCN73641.1 Binding-protein-dependent transport systems inner membrane component [Vibrio nigripulchritudo SFn118]